MIVTPEIHREAAALLMLIGYSVDSDILLTNRVLKRQGNLADKMAGAFTTGFIMTSTAIAAALADRRHAAAVDLPR